MSATRRFVTVDGRRVHYRVEGKGPVALLVHQSPRSSAEYAPLMARLADRYTVIAPDNPGNGLSAPLPAGARTIEDYGDALAKFLSALGVDRVLLYGFHTGAAIGLAFAARHPDRVAVAVLNGLPVPDPATSEVHIARYLLPLEPSWDGGHLAWVWARLREQTIFYPWFSDADADRVAFTPSDGDVLFAACLELLRAGDHYRDAYAAAFRVPTQALLDALHCPATIVSARWDPLYGEMERLRVPENIERLRLGTDPLDSMAVIEARFAALAGTADDRLGVAPATDTGFSGGLLRRHRAGTRRPLVLLHDHHDDSAGAEVATAEAASLRPTMLLDLPGHGESSEPWAGVEAAATAVHDLLVAEGWRDAHLQGFGLGARVAAAVAARGRCAVHRDSRLTTLDRAQHARGAALIGDFLAARETPARLLGAWRMARDGALFDPWCTPVPAAARRPAGDLTPHVIHRRAVAALKSMPSWAASWAALAPE